MLTCVCGKDKKVPLIEHDFLFDQGNARKMAIDNVDRPTTSKIQKRALRKTMLANRINISLLDSQNVPVLIRPKKRQTVNSYKHVLNTELNSSSESVIF